MYPQVWEGWLLPVEGENCLTLTHQLRWVNWYLSDAFYIHNGTRQGCPLSPLLYVMTLEPMLNHLRSQRSIRGIDIRGREYKIAVFADDILLFLTDPLTSMPNLMKALELFQNISNLKINLKKSMAMNISLNTELSLAFDSYPYM